MTEANLMDAITLEDFETMYDEALYAKYMETGCYYDTEYEDFLENEYEVYISELSGDGSLT